MLYLHVGHMIVRVSIFLFTCRFAKREKYTLYEKVHNLLGHPVYVHIGNSALLKLSGIENFSTGACLLHIWESLHILL